MSNPLIDPATGTTVFNNFVKITDWIIRGTGSEHPMPAGLASLFAAADDAKNAVDVATAVQRSNSEIIVHIDNIKAAFNQMAQTIAEMQQVIATQQGVIESLSGAPQQPVQQSVQQPVQQPHMQLADLGEAVATAQQAQPTPTDTGSAGTQTIEVLAADIDAGDLNPEALAALDAEIAKLMNTGQ